MRASIPVQPGTPVTRRNRNLPLTICLSLLLVAPFIPARADKIFLNSGETLECKILRKTETGIFIEYQPAPGIIDEKEIPFADIAKVLKTTPDQAAYEKIKTLFPFPDLMSAEDYDEAIESHFKPFLEKFPESDYLEEVEKFHAEAEEERKLVRSRHRKIDGQWHSARDYEKKRYNLEARIAHKEIERLIEERSHKKALEAFQELEAAYPGAMAYPEAIASILGALESYGRSIDDMITRQPFLQQKQQEGMLLIDIRQQAKIKQAIKDEIARNEARKKLEAEEGRKWKTLFAYDLGGLQQARAVVDAEIARLGSMDLEALRKSSVHIAAALENIADREFINASVALSKAVEAGASRQVIDKLKEKIAFTEGALQEGMETAARAKAKAAAAAQYVTGDEWGTGGDDAPGSALMQSRVTLPTDPEGRSALQIKQEEDEKKAAEEKAAKEAEQKAREEKLAEKTEEIKKQATAAADTAARKAQAAASQVATLASEEGGSLLSNKLPFILAPLLIILVAVALNKRRNDDGEGKPKKEKAKKEKAPKETE